MKLNFKRTFLLGFGFFGISIIWSLYNSYVPIFLKEYGLSLAAVGLIMTFDNWIAILVQPWVGFLSDRTRTRIGRRMPYLLVGAPLAAIFFALAPVLHMSLGRSMSALIAFSTVLILMNLAMALFRTPTIALMPDITPSPLRSQANGIINLMGGLGTALAFLVGAKLYDAGRPIPFIVGAVVMVGAVALVISLIREPKEYAVEPAGEGRQGVLPTIKEIITARDKSAMFILLAILFWFIGYNGIETFWTTYGKEFLGMKESSAAAMLTYMAGAFLIFALPAGFLAGRVGRKPVIMGGLAALTILFASAYFTSSSLFLTVMLILAGVAWAMVNVNSLAMVVDIAPQSKLGSYTGLYYFFSMAAAIVGPPLFGKLIDVFGYPIMFALAPLSEAAALICMSQVRRGEARKPAGMQDALAQVGDTDM